MFKVGNVSPDDPSCNIPTFALFSDALATTPQASDAQVTYVDTDLSQDLVITPGAVEASVTIYIKGTLPGEASAIKEFVATGCDNVSTVLSANDPTGTKVWQF